MSDRVRRWSRRARMTSRLLPVLPLVAAFWLSGCSSVHVDQPAGERTMLDSSAGAGGFDPAEAKDMLEFCVDLDSQDDLVKDLGQGIPEEQSLYHPRPSARWKKIADSRELYAPGQRDPSKNGFPPFNSAWTLWRQVTPGHGGRNVFAVALRGTVVSSKPSVWEDIVIATIAARNGMEYSNEGTCRSLSRTCRGRRCTRDSRTARSTRCSTRSTDCCQGSRARRMPARS